MIDDILRVLLQLFVFISDCVWLYPSRYFKNEILASPQISGPRPGCYL
jgi:hypothetical protein